MRIEITGNHEHLTEDHLAFIYVLSVCDGLKHRGFLSGGQWTLEDPAREALTLKGPNYKPEERRLRAAFMELFGNCPPPPFAPGQLLDGVSDIEVRVMDAIAYGMGMERRNR